MVLVSAVSSGLATPAIGERLARNKSAKETSVRARERPSYDAICLLPDFGSDEEQGPPILVCPRVSLATGYTDNVFRTPDETEDDVFTRLSPRLSVRTDWPNHALRFDFQGEVGRYAENATNDYEDAQVQASGQLDVTEDAQLEGTAGWARQHEERGEPDSPPGILNVNVNELFRQRLAMTYAPSDIFFNVDVEARQYDWHDNGALDNDVRDRSEYEGRLRVGYKLSEETSAFVQPSYNIRRFDQERDAFGFEQDSQGWDARVGFLYDVSSLTYLEASAGYFRQSYEEELYGSVSGVSAGLDLTWNATDLATVTAQLDRSVNETTTFGVSGIVTTTAALRFDYELDYNLISHVGGEVRRSEFDGTNRTDDTYRARAGLSYLINEYLSLDMTYRYDQRASNFSSADYTANTGLVTMRAQY